MARHRPRPPVGRRAGEGHPARLRDATAPHGAGDDGERHHLPRPLAPRARSARCSASRPSRSTRSPSASRRGASGSTASGRRSAERRRRRRGSLGERRRGLRPRRPPRPALRPPLRARSRTSPATSASTRAGWSSRRGGSTRSSRSSRPRCRGASSSSGTRTTAPTSASSRSTSSASGCSARSSEMIPMIRTHEGVDVDLAHLPHDDPAVYAILNEADTVGRLPGGEPRADGLAPAQRPALLLRHRHPGGDHPARARSSGGMVHPFFDRRQGRAPVDYPHPSLEPILKRTLGVPLFQEQLLRIAMVAAGFTGGEAEELRRAMGFKRSARADGRHRDAPARRDDGARHHGRGAGADRPVDHVVRALRLPRVARGELRPHRLRERAG